MDRRDRHGRGMRGPLARPPVPLARSRREDFDDLVLDAAEDVAARVAARPELAAAARVDITDVVLVVEEVPRLLPGDDPDVVPLGHVEDATARTPPTVVLYRRPIEARAARGDDRTELVQDAVVDHLADLLGLDPDDLDPRGAA